MVGFLVAHKYHANGDETGNTMTFWKGQSGSFSNPYFGPLNVKKSDLTEIKNNTLIFMFPEREVAIEINSEKIDCTCGFSRDGSSHRIELIGSEKNRIKEWLQVCYGVES